MSIAKFNKWQSVDGVTRNAVLQVVSSDITTYFSSTSKSFVDVTGMSLVITPTSATSKILVTFNIHSSGSRAHASQFTALQILRGSTAVYTPWSSTVTGNFTTGISASGATSVSYRGFQTLEFLDSPATINEITYKLQASVYDNANAGGMNFNENTQTSGITSGQAVSTITLMEIAQ